MNNMKATSKINHLLAKGLLFSSVLVCSMHGIAQKRAAVSADPRLGKITFTDLAGFQMDEAYVQPNELIRLKIPVQNSNHGQVLPAGSCKIKIGFGSKLTLDSTFDLNSAAMSNYFKWTAAMNSGQLQINGELIAPLPANVDDVTVAFKVKGTVIGKSTITANFLVTNHNTNAIVSDEDGTNNAAYLPYTVTNKPAPASVTTINDVVKEGCLINVSFSSDKEINLVRYDVEVSKDGAAYEKVATLSATGNLAYASAFELPASLQVDQLLVRIKSVERNGRLAYSAAKNVSGICKQLPLKLAIYPNPAHAVTSVTIAASQGNFDGKYKVKMLDMAGKTVMMKEVTLSAVQQFALQLGNIAAGKYLVQVSTQENVQLAVLKFEKL